MKARAAHRGGAHVVILAFLLLANVPRPLEAAASSLVQAQVPAVPDTLELPADSATVIEEFVPRNVLTRSDPVPAGWNTGVWEWDSEGLRSTRAVSLLELLEEVPGVLPLRGGDFGQPSAATAFGLGAGEVRVFLDGAELPPLDGGVVDLARVGLAGLGRVRVERSPGTLQVELFPLQFEDPRPLSYLEVGTGDFQTNLFRGLFAHPDALGGTVSVTLDRLDTAGPQGGEPGVSFGAHVRHALFPAEGLGVAWEFRTMTSKRPSDLWEPPDVGRTDWGVRAHYEWASWLRSEAYLQRSSLGADAGDDATGVMGPLVNEEQRTQVGGRLLVDWEPFWGRGEYRENWGPGWASSEQTLSGGGSRTTIGGASGRLVRQTWNAGETAVRMVGRVWSRPFFGISVFGEVEDGDRGVTVWVPPPEPEPEGEEPPTEPPAELPEEVPPTPTSIVSRTGIRVGAEYRRGGLRLGGAFLSVDADSLHVLGLPTDRDGTVTAGGERTGFEASAELPLGWLLNGLTAGGSLQFWDQDSVWRYLPERSYLARVAFHDTFYPSQNLEVWVDVGVRGRDPMTVPIFETGTSGALEEVPFQQSWFGRLQIRVASVRLFVLWDNFTLRPANQDYPGRVLPQTRAMYGIRWTMWN